MKMHLKLALILGLGGVGGAAVHAQEYEDEERYVPPVGASSLSDARERRQGVVLGGGGARNVPPVYTVRRGDTLWDITGRFYGNPWGWPQVWSYNPEITNPHWIYPHDHIRLVRDGEAPTVLEGGPATLTARAQPGSLFLRDQGYLDEDALREAGLIIGSPEEQMLLSNFDEIYVRFEDGVQPRPGTDYTVFREIDLDEREPEESGTLVRIFGTVHLRSYDTERGMGRAVITESLDPIERGFRIAAIPRRFDVVPPRENARDVTAHVAATLRPLRLSADSQLVFVDAGAEQGVEVGNRFFVVRAGDEWRMAQEVGGITYGETVPEAPEPDEDEYLPEVVAEGRVVNVRPNTSALFITRSTRPVIVGDTVEMRRGF